MAVVIAVDAGTTGVRSLAVDEQGRILAVSYRELTQHFPGPGRVEHDPREIFRLVDETLGELAGRLRSEGRAVAAVGLANQRETAVAWDLNSAEPLGPAIVWQDRRTAERCRQLEAEGRLPLVRRLSGLVLDSYFSASKWEWMLAEGSLEPSASLALGTVDAWLCYKLTGRHATDATNASRTMLLDIASLAWSDELCGLFGIDSRHLGEVVPSSGRVGRLSAGPAGGLLEGVPLSGIAGDQHASLFGQGCHAAGEAKVTYGTGSFVLMTLGTALPEPVDGLLTTVAWQLPPAAGPGAPGDEGVTYALEGAVFSSGATIQWLRDGLGIISEAAETEPLASSVTSSEGVHLVPAFAGLGSPWWDPDTRATLTGLTRGVGRAQIARAAVEAIAFQTRDVVDAMAAGGGVELRGLSADGGAAVMDLLLQLQADQCRLPVTRAWTTEATAVGAAFLAGMAEGVWTAEDVRSIATGAARFEPAAAQRKADADHRSWLSALERARGLSAP